MAGFPYNRLLIVANESIRQCVTASSRREAWQIGLMKAISAKYHE
jgi:hypothetical protein